MSVGELFARLIVDKPRSMRLNDYFQEVRRVINDMKNDIPKYKKSRGINGEIDWEKLGPEFIAFVEKWHGRI